jgi:hypothetical protein
MQLLLVFALGLGLLSHSSATPAQEIVPAYILNEDSHPHRVLPGKTARFNIEAGQPGARMDVKCSLQGDGGRALSIIILRSRGLANLQWPFPTRAIRVQAKVDFDITAKTVIAQNSPAYFEFVNDDPSGVFWHQCYNN